MIVYTNGVFAFLNVWFVYANGAFVFLNVWFVYANGAFVFLNLWFVYTNGAFVFLNLWFVITDGLFIIIYFDPVAVGVLKIDLFHAIDPVGDGILLPCPVFEFNIVFFEVGYIIVYGRNAKTKVGVLIMRGFGAGAGNYMQMALNAYAKPGMAAIMKRLGNGIEADNPLIKGGAGF
jgi:hypothetical protein